MTINNLKVKTGLITPAMAKELLANNTHNRKVSQGKVDLWAESMRRGEWVMNGEAVKIAEDGTVLDGQHRLLAIVQSGVTVPLMVIKGLPQETQDTMDTGKSRSFSDVLSLKGVRNSGSVAAVILGNIRWDKYTRTAAFTSGSRYPVTNGEGMEYLRQHPEVVDNVSYVQTIARHVYMAARTLGIVYTQIGRVADPEDLDDFMTRFDTGVGLEEGSPILLLRKALKINHDNKRMGRNQLSLAALTIKAWNKYIDGDDNVRRLKFSSGGKGKESFPEIKPSGTVYGVESDAWEDLRAIDE